MMEIQQCTSCGVNIVTIIGKLDTVSTVVFENDRGVWPSGPVILDLCRLDYISSSGLRAFLQLKRDYARLQVPVVIAGCFGTVEEVLNMTGFDTLFPIYPTVQDALAVLGAPGPIAGSPQ